MAKDKVKVIAIKGEYNPHGDDTGGDLWFAINDSETPKRLFNYIKNNCEENQAYTFQVEEVSKEDFDREDDI